MDLKLRLADDMRLGRLAVCASLMGSSLLAVPPNTPAPTADLVRIQAYPADTGNTVGRAKASKPGGERPRKRQMRQVRKSGGSWRAKSEAFSKAWASFRQSIS